VYSTDFAASSRQILMFQVERPSPPMVIAGNRDFISRIAVDPKGRLLASMSHDGNLRLFDARNGLLLFSRTGYEDQVSFSRDGRTLAASSTGGLVTFYDLAIESVWHDYGSPVGPPFFAGYSMAFSNDEGFVFAAGNDSVRVWDAENRLLAQDVKLPVKTRGASVLVEPGSGDLFYYPLTGLSRFSIGKGWVTESNGNVPALGPVTTVEKAVGFQLQHFIKHEQSWLVRNTAAMEWQLWPKGDPTKAVPVSKATTLVAAASDDGRWFASANTGPRGKLALYSIGNPQPLAETEMPDTVRLIFSPDGRWLLDAGLDQFVLFQIESGKLEKKFTLPFTTRHPAWHSFSEENGLLALEDENDNVRILGLPDLQTRFLLRPPHPIRISAIMFNRDGTRLLLHGVGERIFEWNLGNLKSELKDLGITSGQ
jgi:WD40 repeat protein